MGREFKSGKLIGWLCLSPATSLVLQSAAVLVSRPDQVNYLRDTTGEYGLHHVIEQNTTLASIHLCDRVRQVVLRFFFVFTSNYACLFRSINFFSDVASDSQLSQNWLHINIIRFFFFISFSGENIK